MTKEVLVYCQTGDGMVVMLPEDVVAVLNLMGYELFFSRTFCDVEVRDDADELHSVRGFHDYRDDYSWKSDLIRWVREGMPAKREGEE